MYDICFNNYKIHWININQPTNLPTNQPTNQPVNQLTNLYVLTKDTLLPMIFIIFYIYL